MNRWRGKTAVITGAGAGIGYATTVALLNEGVNVIGLDFLEERLEKLVSDLKNKTESTLHTFKCDVRSIDSINDVFNEIERNVGKFHIWINNAGIFRAHTIIGDELKDEEIVDVISTNLTGLVFCSRKAYKCMASSGEEGYIINIGSIAGVMTASPEVVKMGLNVYSCSKHAVQEFTEVLRYEVSAQEGNQIRVSSICPGSVETLILEASGLTSNLFKRIKSLKSKDIADTILYLLSTPISVHVTQLVVRALNTEI